MQSYGIQRSTVTKDPFLPPQYLTSRTNLAAKKKETTLITRRFIWELGIVAPKHEPLVLAISHYKPAQSPHENLPVSWHPPARREARNGRRRRRPRCQSCSAPQVAIPSNGGTLIAGWFMSWKFPLDENLGYPNFRKPPYFGVRTNSDPLLPSFTVAFFAFFGSSERRCRPSYVCWF